MYGRRSLVAAITLILALSAWGQQFPTQEKGFSPSKLYHFADIDSINTFNGNLIVTLPLTPTFRVGPLLSYSFTPVYNANVWDARGFDPSLLELRPCRRCNAGLGWSLSLGRLIPPSDPTNSLNDPNKGFLYESPDGRDHPFTVKVASSAYVYSTDETGLRMKFVDSSTRLIEFPDGTTRTFSSPGNDVWNLVQIADPYGNHVDITPGEGSTASHPIWTITEKQASSPDEIRHHTLEFDVTANGSDAGNGAGTTYAQTRLTKISVAAINGASADYVFRYTRVTLPIPGDANADGPAHTTVQEFLLTGIDLVTNAPGSSASSPLLGSYSMAMPDGYETCAPTTRCADAGLLKSLRVPTGGRYTWTWGDVRYPFPSKVVEDPNHSPNPLITHRQTAMGVSTRSLTDFRPGQSPAASTWYYTYQVNRRESCTDSESAEWNIWHQTANAVTAPDGTVNVNYYSIYRDEPCSQDKGFSEGEYGYPLTHWFSDGEGLSLSTETYTAAPPTGPPTYSAPTETSPRLNVGERKRAKYISWETLGVLGGSTFSTSIERTYFHDDCDDPTPTTPAPPCKADQFTETQRSAPDNAGHYKQVSAGGNIDGKTYRTTFTSYPDAPVLTIDANNNNVRDIDDINPWLFGTYTEQCARVEAAPRALDSVTQCGANPDHGLSNGSPSKKDFTWKQFCFNAGTGFLERQRSIRLTAPGSGDLVAAFTPASTGDVATEAYYGGENALGDAQLSMPTANFCTTALSTFGTPGYTLEHTYEYGSLKQSNYANANFKLVDRTIDQNSGLITSESDTAGVATGYEYDLGGRLTGMTPSGFAGTGYTYHAASVTGTLKNAVVTSSQTGIADEGSRTQEFTFDGFGRIIREVSSTATSEMRGHDITYDVLGRKASDTTVGAIGRADTLYPPATKTSTVYDFAGRPVSITAPDGAATTFKYRGIRETKRTVSIVTDASLTDSASTTEVSDALGRLIKVDQPYGSGASETTTTIYTYDVADRLTTVDMTADGVTQHRAFDYDNRGFLLGETHPELGTNGNGSTSYQGYDSRGHARRKVTGSAYGVFDLKFDFDSFERLVGVSHRTSATTADPLKTFTYGDTLSSPPAFSKGKVVTASRFNTIGNAGTTVRVDESYAYGGRGGLLSTTTTTLTTKTVNPNATTTRKLTASYVYSSLGDLATLTYPEFDLSDPLRSSAGAPSRTVENLNENGFLVGVSGYAGARDSVGKIIPGITYTPLGLINTVTHSDNSTDTYTPDLQGMARPRQIAFTNFSSCDAPPAPTIAVPSTTCPNSSASASVPQDSSLTYVWSITGGTITSGGSTSTVTFTAATSGTVHLTLNVTNECGAASASTDIPISASNPSAPSISAPTSVCANSTSNVASVPQNASWSYSWSITGGTISGSTATSSVTFTAGASGTVHLSVVVATSCGTAPAATQDVTVTPAPSTATISAPTSVQPNSTSNTASVPQDSSLTYSWSITGGSISSGQSTASIVFTAGASGTVHLAVTETNTCSSSSTATADISIGVPPDAPASVDAHANGAQANGTWVVNVSWPAVSGATEYRVLRAATRSEDDAGIRTIVRDHVTGTNIDDVVPADTTYIYRVQASSTGGLSPVSSRDVATTVSFPAYDPNLIVRAIDWTQLRRAVRAMCTAAQVGWGFTDTAPDGISMPSGTLIKLDHLIELRSALDAARAAFSLPAIGYHDTQLQTNVTPITLQQAVELRDGVK